MKKTRRGLKSLMEQQGFIPLKSVAEGKLRGGFMVLSTGVANNCNCKELTNNCQCKNGNNCDCPPPLPAEGNNCTCGNGNNCNCYTTVAVPTTTPPEIMLSPISIGDFF